MDIRDNWPKVGWAHIIWFPQCNPRHAFIIWLAIQGRLSTEDRMHLWQTSGTLKCVFCANCEDSHSHLFFHCDYTMNMWNELKTRMMFRGLQNDLQGILVYSLTILSEMVFGV